MTRFYFREPGLTHKATIYTESKPRVAGEGVTSFMEIPIQEPPAFTHKITGKIKYDIAQHVSPLNYSFFMG